MGGILFFFLVQMLKIKSPNRCHSIGHSVFSELLKFVGLRLHWYCYNSDQKRNKHLMERANVEKDGGNFVHNNIVTTTFHGSSCVYELWAVFICQGCGVVAFNFSKLFS